MFNLLGSSKIKKIFSLTVAILFTFNSVSWAAPVRQDTLRAISTGQRDSAVKFEQLYGQTLTDPHALLSKKPPLRTRPSALQSKVAKDIEQALTSPSTPVGIDKIDTPKNHYQRILSILSELRPGKGLKDGYVTYRLTKDGRVIIQMKTPGADYVRVYWLNNEGVLVKTDQYGQAVVGLIVHTALEDAIGDFLNNRTGQQQQASEDEPEPHYVLLFPLLRRLLNAVDIPPDSAIIERDWFFRKSKHLIAQGISDKGLGPLCTIVIIKQMEEFAQRIEAGQVKIEPDDKVDIYEQIKNMAVSLAALGEDAVYALPSIKVDISEAYRGLKSVLQTNPEFKRQTSINKATHLTSYLSSLILIYERLGQYVIEDDIPASLFEIIKDGQEIEISSWLGDSLKKMAINAVTQAGPAAVPGLSRLFKEGDYSLKSSVISICKQIGPAGFPILIEALDDDKVGHQAVRALLYSGEEIQRMAYIYCSPEIISRLEKLAASYKEMIRRIKDTGEQSTIGARLSDTNLLLQNMKGFKDEGFSPKASSAGTMETIAGIVTVSNDPDDASKRGVAYDYLLQNLMGQYVMKDKEEITAEGVRLLAKKIKLHGERLILALDIAKNTVLMLIRVKDLRPGVNGSVAGVVIDKRRRDMVQARPVIEINDGTELRIKSIKANLETNNLAALNKFIESMAASSKSASAGRIEVDDLTFVVNPEILESMKKKDARFAEDLSNLIEAMQAPKPLAEKIAEIKKRMQEKKADAAEIRLLNSLSSLLKIAVSEKVYAALIACKDTKKDAPLLIKEEKDIYKPTYIYDMQPTDVLRIINRLKGEGPKKIKRLLHRLPTQPVPTRFIPWSSFYFQLRNLGAQPPKVGVASLRLSYNLAMPRKFKFGEIEATRDSPRSYPAINFNELNLIEDYYLELKDIFTPRAIKEINQLHHKLRSYKFQEDVRNLNIDLMKRIIRNRPRYQFITPSIIMSNIFFTRGDGSDYFTSARIALAVSKENRLVPVLVGVEGYTLPGSIKEEPNAVTGPTLMAHLSEGAISGILTTLPKDSVELAVWQAYAEQQGVEVASKSSSAGTEEMVAGVVTVLSPDANDYRNRMLPKNSFLINAIDWYNNGHPVPEITAETIRARAKEADAAESLISVVDLERNTVLALIKVIELSTFRKSSLNRKDSLTTGVVIDRDGLNKARCRAVLSINDPSERPQRLMEILSGAELPEQEIDAWDRYIAETLFVSKSASAGLADCVKLSDLDLTGLYFELLRELESLQEGINTHFKEYLPFEMSEIIEQKVFVDLINKKDLQRIPSIIGPFMCEKKKVFLMLVRDEDSYKMIAINSQDLSYLKVSITDKVGFDKIIRDFLSRLGQEQEHNTAAKEQLKLFGIWRALWGSVAERQAAKSSSAGGAKDIDVIRIHRGQLVDAYGQRLGPQRKPFGDLGAMPHLTGTVLRRNISALRRISQSA